MSKSQDPNNVWLVNPNVSGGGSLASQPNQAGTIPPPVILPSGLPMSSGITDFEQPLMPRLLNPANNPPSGNPNIPGTIPLRVPSYTACPIIQPTIPSPGLQSSSGNMNYGRLIRYGYTIFSKGVPFQGNLRVMKGNNASPGRSMQEDTSQAALRERLLSLLRQGVREMLK